MVSKWYLQVDRHTFYSYLLYSINLMVVNLSLISVNVCIYFLRVIMFYVNFYKPSDEKHICTLQAVSEFFCHVCWLCLKMGSFTIFRFARCLRYDEWLCYFMLVCNVTTYDVSFLQISIQHIHLC